MKNFKKVIAFLMVAAMTLGMGLTAFASSTGSAVEVDKVKAMSASKIEEAKAGDTVTIQIIADQDFYCNACKMHIFLDPEFVKTGNDDVVNEANDYLDGVWKIPNKACAANYDPATGEFVNDEAGADDKNPGKYRVTAGTVVAELKVVLAKDVAEGDKIATVTFEYVTDGTTTAGTNVDMYPEDVEIVISAASTQSEPPTSSDVPPTNTQAPTGGQGGQGGQGTDAANNGANNVAQPTTKALPKADDIKTVTNALEACADLIENGNYNAVLSIAKKLDASCFTSADNYNKFAAALKDYEAVLAKPGATDQEKIDAYNKMIELMQENLLSQKGKDTLIANVKAALSSAPATTKAGNGKTKTGDTAPVAALMIVAIAAFGTAVVVYRKKVNA